MSQSSAAICASSSQLMALGIGELRLHPRLPVLVAKPAPRLAQLELAVFPVEPGALQRHRSGRYATVGFTEMRTLVVEPQHAHVKVRCRRVSVGLDETLVVEPQHAHVEGFLQLWLVRR